MKSSVFCRPAWMVLFLLFVLCKGARGDGLLLVSEGKTDYVIALPAAADEPVRKAAEELRDHLRQVTGVELKIVSEDEVAGDAARIVLGPAKRLKQLVPDLDLDSLGHDGIAIKTAGKNLVLAGRGTRGTLYAVYTFLEDVVGCRWWTSEESYVPKKAVLEIPPLDVTYAPPLRYREAFYRDTFDGATAARFKLNGHHHQVPADDWVDLQDNQFRLAQPGQWAAIVDDPKASDGQAARMPGDHHEWATSCPLADDLAYGNPWRCFVVARVEATGTEGVAITMGIYDAQNRKSLAHRSVPAAEVSDGEYRVFDLGAHDVDGGIYVWVAPTARPEEVQAVYVDRVYLIREKDGKLKVES